MQLFEGLVPSFAFLDEETETKRQEIHLADTLFCVTFFKKSDTKKK